MISAARPGGRLAATLAIALMLFTSACSRRSDVIAMRPQGSDPPEVAAALSLGGRLSQDPAGKYQSAINCSSALRLTADRLAPMAGGSASQAIDAVKRAAGYYRDRALQSEPSGRTGASVDSAIAQQLRDKRDDTAAQAQLALACLRALQSKA
jgi:hypothetical protein